MSLRGDPVVQSVALADGRAAEVRVRLADEHAAGAEVDALVGVELVIQGRRVAFVPTPLLPEDVEKAIRLGHEITGRLRAGTLEPTEPALERALA